MGPEIEMTVGELMKQAFTDDPVNWLKWGIVFAVLILGYILVIPLYGKVSDKVGLERKRELARAKGHMVEARLKKKHWTGNPSHRDWHAWYTYEMDGEQRTYGAYFNAPNSPPWTMTLYWVNNPKRLFSMSGYHWQVPKGFLLLFVIALPWLFAMAAMVLLHAEYNGMVM